MSRIYLNATPNPPLANTGTGAAGTVLGTERAAITHTNRALLDTYAQTEANLADAVAKKHSHANSAVLAATTASFTTADETKLDGIAAGAEVNPAGAEREATSGQNGLMSAAYADKLNKLGTVGTNTLFSAVAVASAFPTNNVVTAAHGSGSTNVLVTGVVTFRNTTGGDLNAYFRIRRVGTGAILASGQVRVPANNRASSGFGCVALSVDNPGESFALDVQASGAGIEVTHENGLAWVAATQMTAVGQY